MQGVNTTLHHEEVEFSGDLANMYGREKQEVFKLIIYVNIQ